MVATAKWTAVVQHTACVHVAGCRYPLRRSTVGEVVALRSQPDPLVVRGQGALPVHLTTLGHSARGLDRLAGAEEDAVLGPAAPDTSIAVTPVQGHEAALGARPPPGTGDLVALARRDDAQGGDVTGVVQEGVERHGACGRAETGPWPQAHAARAGGAVQGTAWIVEAAARSWRDRLTAGVACEQKGMGPWRRAPVVR